ncbi:MAG: hypothetical protein ACYCUG_00120 [Acidimicrobiales bacterium]
MTDTACSDREPAKRPRRDDDEAGQVTAFVVIFLAALFAFAGLVLDGGLTLAAQTHAIDEAQAAARAGAQALDTTTYRATGTVVLDPAAAVTAADAYLAAAGDTSEVSVTGDQVSVTVHLTQRMQLLDLVGINQLTVSGTGVARLERGVGSAGP